MTEFIDTHIHLQDFKADFAPRVLENKAAQKLVLIAAKTEDFEKMAALLKLYPQKLAGAFGVHPWYADDDFDEDRLIHKLKEYPKALVGEIGVDALKKAVDKKQHQVFSRQLNIACDFSRPVVVHAARAFMALTEHEKELKKVKYVHHSYTKNRELLQFIKKTGGYVGVGAHFIRQEKAPEMWAEMDIEKILFETDAPYQTDEAFYNEKVQENLEKLAAIARMEVNDLASQLIANANEFLSI